MKLNINEKLPISKISGFNCRLISKEEYDYFKNFAGDTFPFLLLDGMLCMLKIKSDNEERSYYLHSISTDFKIVFFNRNLITNNCTYTVEATVKNEIVNFEISPESLSVYGQKELLKKGILIDERQAKEVQRYLVISAQKAPVLYHHSKLGWEKGSFYSNAVYPNNQGVSKYKGTIDFDPKGSKEIYLDMIKGSVMEHIPLLFVWLVGFCSIILSYLNHYIDLGCIIFALNNLSSKGKTTAAMLAASICSNPIFDKGLITNFSGTSNATVGFVSQCNGHTVVLDEAGTAESLQSRKLLYQICSGRERKRLNTFGELKETAEFNSAVIVTGEHSIIDSTAPNGLRVRIFEITDDLTVDAEHSNNIKSCILQNYALLWDDFCTYIINNIDKLLPDYNAAVSRLKKDYKDNKGELTDRVLEKLAVIYQTGSYVADCFNLPIDLSAIQAYIYKLEGSIKGETDLEQRALDYVVQYVTQNGNRFSENEDNCNRSIDGKIITKCGLTEVSIMKSVVDEILTKNRIDNLKAVYSKWKLSGITVCEKDRPYKRVKLARALPRQDCIVFSFKNDSTIKHSSNKQKYFEEITFEESNTIFN